MPTSVAPISSLQRYSLNFPPHVTETSRLCCPRGLRPPSTPDPAPVLAVVGWCAALARIGWYAERSIPALRGDRCSQLRRERSSFWQCAPFQSMLLGRHPRELCL